MKFLEMQINHRFSVCLSKEELQLLLSHSAGHLDRDCKEASRPGGFLQVWRQYLANDTEITLTLSDREMLICGSILEKLESNNAKSLLESFCELYRSTDSGKLPPGWWTPSWFNTKITYPTNNVPNLIHVRLPLDHNATSPNQANLNGHIPMNHNITKNCDNCGNLFTPSRITSRFCCEACRVTYFSKGRRKPITNKVESQTNTSAQPQNTVSREEFQLLAEQIASLVKLLTK